MSLLPFPHEVQSRRIGGVVPFLTNPSYTRPLEASSEAWGIFLSNKVSWTCQLIGSCVVWEVSNSELKESALGSVILLTKCVHVPRLGRSGNRWTETIRVQETVKRLTLICGI